MTEDKRQVELRKDQAGQFLCRLFELAGVEPCTASATAEALVEAELEGNASHGLLQAPVYVRRLLAGTISGTARLKEVHRGGAISVFDAGLALGHAAAGQLAAIAADDARKHGVSVAAVRSATHFGVAGRYARMLAETGLIGIVMCNSRAMMPAPGGQEPVVGTNPLAIAVPCAGTPPIVFDMAMSAAAMGRIRQAAQRGEAIPLGWAVDAEGRDTTDAGAAIRGMLLPAAGPKGFGLAFVVDLLCALSGGTAGSELGSLYAPPEEKADCSWLFIAIDPAQFGLAMPYAERVAELAATVRRAAPDPSLALPGDRKRAAAVKAGDFFKLAPAVAADLNVLSRQLGGLELRGTEGWRTCRPHPAKQTHVARRRPHARQILQWSSGSMPDTMKFYIDGTWVTPDGNEQLGVFNPATEEEIARISLGSAADVDRAAKAARKAFATYSESSREERLGYLHRIVDGFRRKLPELARMMTEEMGSPITFSTQRQATVALFHFEEAIRVLEYFEFEWAEGVGIIRREPIGVCGLITPWNWPLNQVASKVAPALATGCTIVLKPSEIAPLSAMMLAEIIDEAGVPAGVFNLVNGAGIPVGEAIAAHPEIDMVSFTGSTRAGIRVAQLAAKTVKRVSQELGGKSANIILDDIDIPKAVAQGIAACFTNAGQNCQSPTRMLVSVSQRDAVMAAAKATVQTIKVGDPMDPETELGPLVSRQQFDKVQDLIQSGIDEGATLVAGGPGHPAELNRGHFVRPSVFADVEPRMRIAREEIFGPVLSIMTYETDDEAVAIANNTPFGLAGFVQSADPDRARRIANRMRAGRIYYNGAPFDRALPFGGYKQSGNGREFGRFGFEDYLEVKALLGFPDG